MNYILSIILSFLIFVDSFASQGPSKKPLVVVVGGYSSGALLPSEIRRFYANRGIKDVFVMHVPDQIPAPKAVVSSFVKDDFDIILNTSDPEFLNVQIRDLEKEYNLSLKAVMTGYEGGVEVTDAISEDLAKDHSIATNGTALSRARREKNLMMQAIAPLRRPKEFVTNDPIAATEWVKKEGLLNSPGSKVVVKPVKSAATVGVTFPKTLEEVRNSFGAVLNDPSNNEFDQKNELATVQEYLKGPEFAVNVVTLKHQGHVYRVVTDIWLYHKRPGPTGNDIYHYDELVDPKSIPPKLIEYVYAVMDKLQITTGWGHAEVKIVEGEPVLVEIAARAMGARQPEFVQKALGHSQIDLGMLAFLEPESFIEYAKAHPIYEVPKNKKLVFYTLKSPEVGLWYSDLSHLMVTLLPSFVKYRFTNPNFPQPLTIDLATATGDVWLEGSSEQVQKDVLRLSELEDRGLYQRKPLCSLLLSVKSTIKSFLK